MALAFRFAAAFIGTTASTIAMIVTLLIASSHGGTTLPTSLVVGVIVTALAGFAGSYGWLVNQVLDIRADIGEIKGHLGVPSTHADDGDTQRRGRRR